MKDASTFSKLTKIHVMEKGRNRRQKAAQDLQFAPKLVRVNKSRRLIWVDHVACMEEKKSAYKVFVGKTEGRKPSRRP